MRVRRAPIVLAVALALLAGGVADRVSRSRADVSRVAADRALMPTSAPADALSSTWFCLGATSGAGTGADGVVSVANPTDRAVTGIVTVVPFEAESRSKSVTVGPYGVIAVALRDVATGPYAAALVDLDAGQVAAELVVRGPGGSDAVPCSSRASDRWYFADGVTAKDATLVLSLFNPFPEDAIVDLSFSTDQGRAAPAAFRPIIVPARTLVVRSIGDHVRRRNAVATEVSVRTGRVVAAQTQTRSAPGHAGLSVTTGSPSLGSTWHFPDGVVRDGSSERFSVSNPSDEEATVLFQVTLEEGVAEDFERTLPARSRLDVVLNEEVGVPRNVAHSTTVRSLDGAPVVVARTVEVSPPAGTTGRADILGARRAATRWLFPAGGTADGVDEWITVANPGSRVARVSVSTLGGGDLEPVAGMQDLEVGAGRRLSVRVNDHLVRDPLPLVAVSSAPVVVERSVYVKGGAGVWATIGIPVP